MLAKSATYIMLNPVPVPTINRRSELLYSTHIENCNKPKIIYALVRDIRLERYLYDISLWMLCKSLR